MTDKLKKGKTVKTGINRLRVRLQELEETLRAIRCGEVDGLVVAAPAGDKVFTLQGADHPYRVLVEAMEEGAATLTADGIVLYANRRLAEMCDMPLAKLIGSSLCDAVRASEQLSLPELLLRALGSPQKVESNLQTRRGKIVPVSLSLSPLREDDFHGICLIATDLTQRIRAEEALQRKEESLRRLSGRLLQLQDEERRRMARDLHDTTGQKLALLSVNLDVLDRVAAELPPRSREAIVESRTVVKEVLEEIRTLSYLLHPPLLDEMGLASATRWYVEGFVRRSNIQVDLNLSPELSRLPQELEITLFRILQESLTNVHRHSGSSTASVSIVVEGGIATMEVKDRGCRGDRQFLTSNGGGSLGVGIRGMRERVRQLGGGLEIQSGSEGTTVKAKLPVPNMKATAAGESA
jgi:PAS domain S-box-containing protein